jgi:hypothetical protein
MCRQRQRRRFSEVAAADGIRAVAAVVLGDVGMIGGAVDEATGAVRVAHAVNSKPLTSIQVAL